MFCITPTNKIILTKGDNAEIDIRLYDKEEREVKILPSDIITFTVRKSKNKSVVIQKTAELNSIYLVPSDTSNLIAGTYVYDIDLLRDNERQTIIPQSFFNIVGEV